jgi:hypothetical protein
MMNTFLRNNRALLIGIGAGAVGGLLYYRFVGCANGTCMITSNPFISTLYGSFMGGLLGSMFKKSPEKEK